MLSQLLLLYFPAAALCGLCQIHGDTLECAGVTNENFIYEFLKQRGTLKDIFITKIAMIDSNYSLLEKFPDLNSMDDKIIVNTIVIQNSSIKSISYGAFIYLNKLRTLDLSQNIIEDFSFVITLPNSVKALNLSNNNLKEINLEFLDKKNLNLSILDLSRNHINSILPSENVLYVETIDLSYNELTQFIENDLKLNFYNLNISYNKLETLEINTEKGVLALTGNGDILINSKNELYAKDIYMSYIPENLLNVENLLSVTDTFLGTLSEKNPLDIYSTGPYVLLDLSNTSLSNISENYFKLMDIEKVHLRNNNLSSLTVPLFESSQIAEIDLSFSNIKVIAKQVFSQMYFLERLNLSGNLLEETGNICETLNSLSDLDLSRTRIKYIDTESLQHCTSLKQLFISKSLIMSATFPESGIEIIDLSENVINSVRTNDFRYLSQLKLLNLSTNYISSIAANTFKNLHLLEILDLSNNFIQQIEGHAFSNLNSIIFIDLSNNKLQLIESEVFEHLSVEILNLQENHIKSMQTKAFDSLYNLKRLDLSEINLQHLENNVFYNLSKIETIDLSKNNLTVLESFTFSNLPLKQLYLSKNPLQEMRSRAFNNLTNLKSLNLSNSKISSLKVSSFFNIHLNFIDLTNNTFNEISSAVFGNVNVSNIYLNQISHPVYLDNTVRVTNLILQFIGNFTKNTITNINLKNLFIVDSEILLMTNSCFFGAFGLKQLFFVNSNVYQFEPGIFTGLFSLLSLDVSILFMQNNNVLIDDMFLDLQSLKILTIADSQLSRINNGAFSGLFDLQELNLVGNKLKDINAVSFKPLSSSLKQLDLSRNIFSILYITDITNSLRKLNILKIEFASITELLCSNEYSKPNSVNELYLTGNSIEYLDENIFESFVNLKILYLNRNKLKQINSHWFTSTSNLEDLRLDHNKLDGINVDIFNEIKNLKILDISHNYDLFSSNFSDAGIFLAPLQNLNVLFLDNTNLGNNYDFVFSNIKDLFPLLEWIGINNNNFKCSILVTICINLRKNNISFIPFSPADGIDNLNGISCIKM